MKPNIKRYILIFQTVFFGTLGFLRIETCVPGEKGSRTKWFVQYETHKKKRVSPYAMQV